MNDPLGLGLGNTPYDYKIHEPLSVDGEVTPGYNHAIPSELLTPDLISTFAGTLRFTDGFPDDRTAQLAYNFIDTARATSAFLDFIPMSSMEAIRKGQSEMGLPNYNDLLIFEDLMTSDSLFLTGNTETVYGSIFFDLDEHGPIVIDFPPGAGPSTVNDAYFQYVTDLGNTGPDKGHGGKYLIYNKEWKENPTNASTYSQMEASSEYYMAQSPSYVNWLIVRGYLIDGKTDNAVDMWCNRMKIYPYSEKDSTEPTLGKLNHWNASGSTLNTIHPISIKFFEGLNDVIQREPVNDLIEMEQLGMLASIGIRKGQEFKPSSKEIKFLEDGAAIGNALARSVVFAPRDPRAKRFGPDSGWWSAFIGGSYKWWNDESGVTGINKDARTAFFTIATVNTPAMILAMPGVGSQYGFLAIDEFGNGLDGASAYRLVLPPNIPALDFWSIVVYDTQTRSMLQTDQPYPSKNSIRDSLMIEPDGSTIIYFAPDPISGHESNWIRTVPGKGWFLCLRLYAPTEDWFEDRWIPGDLEILANKKTTAWFIDVDL